MSRTSSGESPLGIAIVPLLLVSGPVGRVVVLLIHAERDARRFVEVVEVTRLPREHEVDERHSREHEEHVEHPVRHHPCGLVVLRSVVREGGGWERESGHDENRENDERTSHCCPGTVGGMSFCDSGGSL